MAQAETFRRFRSLTPEEKVGEYIRSLRKEAGLTQAEVARRIGVGTQPVMASVEKGSRKLKVYQYLLFCEVVGADLRKATQTCQRLMKKRKGRR